MIYVRRARSRYCKPTGTSIGFLIAALGWGVHVFGFYHSYESLWHFGAVLVLIGCVLSVFEMHALFRFFPAIAVLIFVVPVPGILRLRIAAHWKPGRLRSPNCCSMGLNSGYHTNGKPAPCRWTGGEHRRSLQRPPNGLRPDPRFLFLLLCIALTESRPIHHSARQSFRRDGLQHRANSSNRMDVRLLGMPAKSFTTTAAGSCCRSHFSYCSG